MHLISRPASTATAEANTRSCNDGIHAPVDSTCPSGTFIEPAARRGPFRQGAYCNVGLPRDVAIAEQLTADSQPETVANR